MLTSDQKGAAAEAAIAHEALRLGLQVWRPVLEGSRCDLILDDGAKLVRVQCKWAVCRGNALVIRCYSSRRSREGFRYRRYTCDEVDALAAYAPELGRCYFVPLARVRSQGTIQLRVEPTLNNQRLGIHWASEFELAARLREEFALGP